MSSVADMLRYESFMTQKYGPLKDREKIKYKFENITKVMLSAAQTSGVTYLQFDEEMLSVKEESYFKWLCEENGITFTKETEKKNGCYNVLYTVSWGDE